MTYPTTWNTTPKNPPAITVQTNAAGTALGLFNVKDYGAIGDGVADDTAAIQACFAACIAQLSGTIVFPQGNYLHTALTLQPASSQIHCNIIGIGGSGAFGVTLTYIGTGGTALTIKNNTNYKMEGIRLVNGATGAVGLLLSSLTPGSNHGGFTYDRVKCIGFTTGLQLGESSGAAVSDSIFNNLETSNCTTGILVAGNTAGALGGANFTTIFQFNHWAAGSNTTSFRYTGPQGSNQTVFTFNDASQGQNTLEFDLQAPCMFHWDGYSESQNQSQFMKCGFVDPTLNCATATFIDIGGPPSYIAYPSTPSNIWAQFNQPGMYNVDNATIATGHIELGGFDGGGGPRKSSLTVERSNVISSGPTLVSYRAGSNTVWRVDVKACGYAAEETVNTYDDRTFLFLTDGTQRIISRFDWSASASTLDANDTLDGLFNVKSYGATGDGSTNDATAINLAIAAAASASGGVVYFPAGNYKVTSSLTITSSNIVLLGQGQRITTITSGVVGASTILITASGIVFTGVRGMKLIGNGLTGASGNGHAIGLKSSSFGSPFSPSQSLFENLEIRDFLGTGDTDGHGTGIAACGIMCYGGLQNTYRKIYIANCAFGFYLDSTNNENVVDCLVDGTGANTNYGLLGISCERLQILGGDWVASGKATTYSLPGFSAPTGNMALFSCHGASIHGNKFKNGDRVNLLLYVCRGVSVAGNFIRANEHIGAYVVSCPGGISITGNDFDVAQGSTVNPQYLLIYDQGGGGSHGFNISGNIFRIQGGQATNSLVEFLATGSSSIFDGMVVEGNYFGDSGVSSAVTVTSMIKVSNCTLQGSRIANNSFDIGTNVTVTNGIYADISTAFVLNTSLGPNNFWVNGGTITNKYNTGGQPLAPMLASPTYAANTVIDCNLGCVFMVGVTNGTAFTIDFPLVPQGLSDGRLTIIIKNFAGGALGAATFAAGYELQAAWVQPAAGKNRSITFVYDGTKMYETSRVGADVSN